MRGLTQTFEAYMREPKSFRGVCGDHVKFGRRVWRMQFRETDHGTEFVGMRRSDRTVKLVFAKQPIAVVRGRRVTTSLFDGWLFSNMKTQDVELAIGVIKCSDTDPLKTEPFVHYYGEEEKAIRQRKRRSEDDEAD